MRLCAVVCGCVRVLVGAKTTCFEVLLTKIQNEIRFSQVSDRCFPAQMCYFCQHDLSSKYTAQSIWKKNLKCVINKFDKKSYVSMFFLFLSNLRITCFRFCAK